MSFNKYFLKRKAVKNDPIQGALLEKEGIAIGSQNELIVLDGTTDADFIEV